MDFLNRVMEENGLDTNAPQLHVVHKNPCRVTYPKGRIIFSIMDCLPFASSKIFFSGPTVDAHPR
jgi:hypothetical protein